MSGRLHIARLEAYALRWPLDVPVATSFGAMRDRPAVLVRLYDREGAMGWGEAWCNFPAPGAEHRVRLLEQVLAPLVLNHREGFNGAGELGTWLANRTRVLALQSGEPGPLAQAAAAVEMGAWDLAARRAGIPLWQLLGGRGRVPVYASGIHPEAAEEVVARAAAAGHERFKIKVGFDLEQDLATVERLVRQVPAASWMVDANQGWDASTATEALRRLADLGLSWVEEPIPADASASSWRAVAALGVPLAGGENLRGRSAFVQAARWLSVLQPDVGKWGGVSGALAVAAVARRRGRWFCPHWLGAGVGLACSVAVLDAHLARTDATVGWAEVDVNPNPWRDELMPWTSGISEGWAALMRQPGVGAEPVLPPARYVSLAIGVEAP